ncbi:MAG: WcaF family extracellular polysaccharide biosynthesis acetyltransferase [Planctomycetota bacterium]
MPDTAPPVESAPQVDLSRYTPGDYHPGRGKLTQVAWYFCSLALVECRWLPFSSVRCAVLRWFGARIGHGVRIKPRVRIKFPWRLSVGDYTWIGEDAWIDNLADVQIGSHACVSQGAYLCTGSHDARSTGFELITKPITLADGAWVAARAVVLPGVELGPNAMAAAGSVVTKSVPAGVIVGGNPARPLGERSPS